MIDETDRAAAFEQAADEPARSQPPPPSQLALSGEGAALWVDKNASCAFVERLSDERQVLRWIKQRGPIVCGTPAPPPATRPGWQGAGWSGDASSASAAAAAAASGRKLKTARPERPILLTAGPPGLGKTTLAHVAARHAGYGTIEINSSDHRMAEMCGGGSGDGGDGGGGGEDGSGLQRPRSSACAPARSAPRDQEYSYVEQFRSLFVISMHSVTDPEGISATVYRLWRCARDRHHTQRQLRGGVQVTGADCSPCHVPARIW